MFSYIRIEQKSGIFVAMFDSKLKSAQILSSAPWVSTGPSIEARDLTSSIKMSKNTENTIGYSNKETITEGAEPDFEHTGRLFTKPLPMRMQAWKPQ